MDLVTLFSSAIKDAYISTVRYWLSNFRFHVQGKHGSVIKIIDQCVDIIIYNDGKVMIWLKGNFHSPIYILKVKSLSIYQL